MTIDKRRAKRISVQLPVTVYLFDEKGKSRLGGPVAGQMKNFSLYGAALTLASVLLGEKHLFYTCHDNEDIKLQLVYEHGDSPGRLVTILATPVWFDRDHESETKQFVVGINFLESTGSEAIKILTKAASNDEKRLMSLWKKLF